MARLLLWPLRIIVPAVFLALMVTFIRFPLGSEPREGMVRLSWRTVGQRVRICEKYTPAELERLPKHMRINNERCSQSLLPYRLQVRWDSELVVERIIRPAGWRGDRPLFVNEEFTAMPGEHRLKVTFRPLKISDQQEQSGQLARARAEAVREATIFELERPVTLRAGRIVMVGLDEDNQRLFLLAD